VGKGTVFRRFGNRAGLLSALVDERMGALVEAVESGPPPLGPGPPAEQRLVAFFDAVIDVATKNLALMSAYEQTLTGPESTAASRQASAVYQAWHAHVGQLITETRPDLDAELVSHLLLGSLHSDLVRHLLRTGESDRLLATLRQVVGALLRPAAGSTSPE
jgi:AcrR family transcriptional regulator